MFFEVESTSPLNLLVESASPVFLRVESASPCPYVGLSMEGNSREVFLDLCEAQVEDFDTEVLGATSGLASFEDVLDASTVFAIFTAIER